MSYSGNTTSSAFYTTTAANDSNNSQIGFLYLAVSCVLFGTNLIPAKHYEIGDGMFFQFTVGVGIFLSNFILYCFQGFPKFYLLPVLGGLFWSMGNLNTAVIIKCLGIGLGTFCTNIVCLVVGWANARFGWFGLSVEEPKHPFLNYIGVTIAALSAFTLLFIKTNIASNNEEEEERNLIKKYYIPINNEITENVIVSKNKDFFDRMSPGVKRTVGFLSASIAGFFYGITYSPILYLINNDPNASKDLNNYSFPLSVGIFISSLFFFIIYSVVMKSNPRIYPKSIFPCMWIGILWCFANLTYLLSTTELSQAITYPISSCCPAIIMSVVGVFYKEITGFRNYAFLFLSGLIAIVGSAICGISK